MNQPLIRNALVVGAGFSGMSSAIALRQLGTAVDLVEIDPSWRSDGAGIIVGAAALRAFQALGIFERYQAQAVQCEGDMVVPRPLLARILADATIAAGADVRLGITVKSLRQDADGVDVEFTDTRGARYDLLVCADGQRSKMRDLVLRAAARPVARGPLALPWHHGRALLIGDALHGSAVRLSSRAFLGMEEAVVLAQELARARSVADALARFGQRRWDNSRDAALEAVPAAGP